jgi:hypothetical protein
MICCGIRMTSRGIGIILCKSKSEVVAEYALRDIRKPVGVSEYRLTEALPKRLRGSLPAIEQLEAELKQSRGLPGRVPVHKPQRSNNS